MNKALDGSVKTPNKRKWYHPKNFIGAVIGAVYGFGGAYVYFDAISWWADSSKNWIMDHLPALNLPGWYYTLSVPSFYSCFEIENLIPDIPGNTHIVDSITLGLNVILWAGIGYGVQKGIQLIQRSRKTRREIGRG